MSNNNNEVPPQQEGSSEQQPTNCPLVNQQWYPIYKEGFKNNITEIPLTVYSKNGAKYMNNIFVSIPCDVCLNNYEIKDKEIINPSFSENFVIEDSEKQTILNEIKQKISQNEDAKYPNLKERPVVLSLPSDNGKKEKWQIDTIQIVKSMKKFILVGSAGSGKTIIARRFGLELIEQPHFFPIYIELKDFFYKNENINIDLISQYISENYKNLGIQSADLYQLIFCHQDELYFIFDGIDEIYNPNPNCTSELICTRLNQFINGQKNIILTSREGYSGLTELDSFPIVKIEEIQSKHIEELFKKYSKNHTKVEEQYNSFKEKLNQIPSDLTNRPLFIVLLTILFEENKTLPDSKIDIYERFINLLLFRKQHINGYESITNCLKRKNELISVLEEIAYTTLLDGNISNEKIKQYLKNDGFDDNSHEKIIEYLYSVAGILEHKSEGFAFVHRSFCEYLSAKKICKYLQSPNGDSFYEKIDSNIDILKEPLLFVGDILRNSGQTAILRDFLNNLAGKEITPNLTLWIVSQLYRQGDFIPYSELCLKGVVKQHLSLKNILSPKKQVEIAKLLGLLGDDRKGVSVNADDIPDIHWCKIENGKFKFGLSETHKEILSQKDVVNTDRDLQEEEIDLSEYEISKYPITIKQFASFLQKEYLNSDYWNYSAESPDWFNNHSTERQNELIERHKNYSGNYPANYINWYEANAFCKWLSSNTSENISLPTIEQWEKAAKIANDSLFPWGNEYDEKLCNTNKSAIKSICPVGCFIEVPDKFPLDMCGNVWEWCLDTEGNKKVVRGGSYLNEPYKIVRNTFNGRDVADFSVDRQGFRIVKSVNNFRTRNFEIKDDSSQNNQNQQSNLNIDVISEKDNKGKKVEEGKTIKLKYSVAYSEDNLNREQNLIQSHKDFELLVSKDNLNPYVYAKLINLTETSTIIVKINANIFAQGNNYNDLFDLTKDLYFEFHINSI